jgi:LacI family transcriptional regulator
MAGRLLFEQIRINDDVALFHFIRRGDYDSVQVTRRREGFCDYFTQHSHQGQIRPLQMHAEDDGYNEIALTSFFEANPQLKAGVLFNSRAAFVCRYLEKAGLANGFRLVGYDVLDGNVACLQRGPVTHLIGQRPEVQGFHAVKALFRHLVINETNELLNYMPIDILVKENIAYYNH